MICIMFNMLSLIGCGVVGLVRGKGVWDDYVELVFFWMWLVGVCEEVVELLFDVVMGFFGFGLVYVFFVFDVMIEGVVKEGLNWWVVMRLVVEILVGFVLFVVMIGEYLVIFCDWVMSFGGIMVVGLKELEFGGVCVFFFNVIEVVIWKVWVLGGD